MCRSLFLIVEDAAHLLRNGALPNREQLRELSSQMARLRKLPDTPPQIAFAAGGSGVGRPLPVFFGPPAGLLSASQGSLPAGWTASPGVVS